MQEIVYDMIKFKNKDTGEYYSFPTLKGNKGDTGKSAYQSAVELGFTGSEAEWLESLKYVSSPEYDTLLASLIQKETNAATSAASAKEDADAAKSYYEAISGLKGFEMVVLETGEYSADGIPTIDNPKDSTFYFVPSGNGGNNNYNEYIYVNNKWELVGAEEVDLTDYVIRSELDDYVLTTTLTEYATKEDLNDYVPTTTLTEYATIASLDNYVPAATLTEYATVASLDSYATTATLTNYAEKSDLDNYAPTSTLTNYVETSTLNDYALTSTLTNYATVSALDNYVPTTTLTEYATITSLDNYVPTATLTSYALKTELVSAEEKAAWNAKYDLSETGITEEELSTEVRVKLNSFFEADPVDKDLLAAYALKTELLDYVPKTSIKDYALKTDLNNYATTAVLSNYAELSALDNYATTATLTNYAETATLNNYALTSTLTSYATKEDLNNYAEASALDDYALTSTLTSYALKSDLDDYATTTTLTNYVEKSTLDDYATTATLTNYVENSALDNYATTATLTSYALKTELASAEEKEAWNAKYDKPEDGIPLTDLSEDVQEIINNPQIEVDNTLSIEGAAADAKTTGDILATKVGPEEIVKFIQWDNAVDGMTMATTNNMVIMKEEEYEKLKVKLPNTFYFIYDDTEEAETYDL